MSASMHLDFIRHNGSSCVATLTLEGPVPRVGEMVHIPQEMREDMERHEVGIVAHVHYRISEGQLAAHVTVIASHDTSTERWQTLSQCGWLADPQDA